MVEYWAEMEKELELKGKLAGRSDHIADEFRADAGKHDEGEVKCRGMGNLCFATGMGVVASLIRTQCQVGNSQKSGSMEVA